MPRGHDQADGGRPRSRVRLISAVAVALLLLGANAAYRSWRAVEAGTRAKTALVRAEDQLNAREPKLAREHLADAGAGFRQARRQLDLMGPVLPVARFIPFIRVQTRGVEAFTDAGVLLSDAGTRLADSAGALIDPSDQQRPVSDAVEALRGMHSELAGAVQGLSAATDKVAGLEGYRLLGPIDGARDDLVVRLPAALSRAASAERGLGALLSFLGGSGPRRYLFFSQNPDEIRPTGGFLGTYGLIVADGERLNLERFESIDAWQTAHPAAFIAADQAPPALRYSSPPSPQRIANVNAVADWPTAARLALDLWQKGGEAPADGVVSVTPGFLRRVLAVIGSVEVPSYGETVNAATVTDRFDFYTRQTEDRAITNEVRKDFVAELGQVVMQRLLSAPASQWEPLARSIGEAFEAREAMAWSADDHVAAVLAERQWDGALPATAGDFFYGAEFQYETKSGRGLRRTYDHTVDLRPDGSALVTTAITTRNPVPRSPFNDIPVTYVTVYGPQGAVLDAASDPQSLPEPSLAGHPAAAWFRGAPPLSQSTLKVVWEAPRLVEKGSDGTRSYRLRFMRLPDHTGDVLNLRVNLPSGWAWEGGEPPSTFDLDKDLVGAWRIKG